MPKFFIFFCISICLFLSFWQLLRFKEKKSWQKIQASAEFMQPLLSIPNNLSRKYEGRKFVFNGQLDTLHIFLRDNSYFIKNRGYLAYMPFVQNKNTAMARLGWIKSKNSLEVLSQKKQTFSGKVYCQKGKEFKLKTIPVNTGWPKVIQTYDHSEINSILKSNFSSCFLDVDFPGFKKPAVKKILSPERHLGYSLQWILFAVIIFIIYRKLRHETT